MQIHGKPFKIAIVLAIILVSSLILFVYSSIFTYRWISGNINVYPPLVWFADPGTPGVNVSLENQGTRASVIVNTPGLDIVLDKRNAIFYETFDTDPIGKNITVLSCNWNCRWVWDWWWGWRQVCSGWNWDPNRKALFITANTSTTYYGGECMVVANIDVSQYASMGRRIYVATLVLRSDFSSSGTYYFDAVYINTTLSRLYTIGYENVPQMARTGDSISSKVFYWASNTGWRSIARRSLGISNTTEYEYLSYIVSWIDFSSWYAYHWNETVINTGSIGSTYRFIPNRVGVGYITSTTSVTGTVYFDNLVVTVDAPPWFVNVTNVPRGWRVVLKNATGGIVSQAVASGDGVASLSVAPPLVDLTLYPNYRDGFIITNGVIEVYDDKGSLVVSRRFDYVVGGDVYRLNGFRGYVLRIDSEATRSFQAQLVLAQFVDCGSSYIYVYLVNTSYTSSTPIEIYRGIMFSQNTSIINMTRYINNVAGYIYADAYLPSQSRCSLLVEFRYSFSNWSTLGINTVNITFIGV